MLTLFLSGLIIFAAYAHWPWWIAAAIGASNGVLLAVSRLRASPWWDHPDKRNRLLLYNCLLGIVVGGAWTTAIYFVFYWLFRTLFRFT